MKTSYDSIIINAAFVGSKSRKAIYLVNPRNMDGTVIYKDISLPTSWQDNKLGCRVSIEWEHANPEYTELPWTKITPGMLVETISTIGGGDTLIGQRMVDGKLFKYVELNQRINIAVPKWFMSNFKRKYTSVKLKDNDNEFSNSYSHYNIIDDVAKSSHDALVLQERPDSDWMVSNQGLREPALEQWLIDNPEYQNDASIL